ncbi:DUF397 domain-containing protein [Micromonospora sp. NBC_01813]
MPVVGVCDSKDQHSPALLFAPSAWQAFTRSVRVGTLDSDWTQARPAA